MYYYPTYIRSYVGSGGKEDAAADGHSYHAYTYMIAFTCFLTVTLLSCMNCTFSKVPRRIVDDMYYYIAHNTMNQMFKA